MKLIDLTGQRFGKLVVLERDFEYQKQGHYKKPYWKCKCDCGNIKTILGKCLREGKTTNCGCAHGEHLRLLNFKDLTGKHFGKLTVLQYLGSSRWECLCSCGNKTITSTQSLQSGDTSSCGCMRSKGEYLIKTWLTQHNISYRTEYTFPELRNSNGNLIRFDFAILDGNQNPYMMIEFNGRQHYNKDDPWFKDIIAESDILKQEFCKKKDLLFYVIKYDESVLDKLKEFNFR